VKTLQERAEDPYFPTRQSIDSLYNRFFGIETLPDAWRLAKAYVEHYNNVHLNSAIGYITPKNMLAGYQQEIQAERDRKLEAAREQRKNRRQRAT